MSREKKSFSKLTKKYASQYDELTPKQKRELKAEMKRVFGE